MASLLAHNVRHAVLSPGSRSTPLAYALVESQHIEAVPILDERSAGFFAVGMAKALGRPVAVLCTSITQTSNY